RHCGVATHGPDSVFLERDGNGRNHRDTEYTEKLFLFLCTLCLCGSYRPPWKKLYFTLKPSRGSKRLPSARTASTQTAAGVPSFIGWPVMVSLVPTAKSLGRMPARCSVLGPSASNPHVVTVPFLFLTSTSSQECGLVYWNCLTTPSTVIVFSFSNIVPE